MEVIEVTWGKDTEKKHYELWTEAKSGANVLRKVQATYQPLPTKASELPDDVSSPIGLFQTTSLISPEENERLERCLSDLLLWVIQPQLAISSSIILIEGPCLRKLIGRLAYRFPRAELTIAFVTLNGFPQRTNIRPPHRDTDWDGPSPPFHVDSITRTYFHKHRTISVELFSQGLSRYRVDEVRGTIAYGVEAKLHQAQDSILRFAEALGDKSSNVQRGVTPLPIPQRSFSNESDEFNEITLPPRAAKRTKSIPKEISDERNQSELPIFLHPDANASQQLSDEELFNERCDQKTSTETGKKRYEVWKTFIERENVYDLDDKKRFLDFIESTLNELKYRKNYVHILLDLKRWYGQYRKGEPHGTKR